MSCLHVVAPNTSPRRACEGLAEGVIVHGLSDGRWSLIDLLLAITAHTGPADLVISTWATSAAHSERMERAMARRTWRDVRMLLDEKVSRWKPDLVDIVRRTYGSDAVRIWACHAKFCIWTGGALDVLLMTSANLNQNRRIENFTIFADSKLAAEYLALVDNLFEKQPPKAHARDARRDTYSLFPSAPT